MRDSITKLVKSKALGTLTGLVEKMALAEYTKYEGYDAKKKKARVPYVSSLLAREKGVFVAASDYMKILPAAISQWFPGPLHCLGTDGFGRSDGREELRNFFEVDARYIVVATLKQLASIGELGNDVVAKAIVELRIDPGKLNPHVD